MRAVRRVTSRPARDAADSGTALTLYYASDVHGSELCWRKFLAAGRFYKAQALVMGGDLTAKAIVPIDKGDDGCFRATVVGETRTARNTEELEQLLEAVRFNGMYPWMSSREEIARYAADQATQAELFERIMVEELRRWIALADERMAAYGIEVFVMAGNDDPWSVDDVLQSAQHVQFCDDRIVMVGGHEMLSLSYANRTPWNSPRELDEDDLYLRIKRLAEQLERPKGAIFNLHVPPYNSGLDRAVEINPSDLSPVYRSGSPHEIPVGSTAVREILDEYQPLLALHGHIHEARGEAQIGRTLAINSGSEYNSGRIHGVVVKLADEDVVSRQFVIG